MTAVEFLEKELFEKFAWRLSDVILFDELIAKAKEMEKEQREKLWTNQEVFDMLYKTDKFLMIDLREYWKTIEK